MLLLLEFAWLIIAYAAAPRKGFLGAVSKSEESAGAPPGTESNNAMTQRRNDAMTQALKRFGLYVTIKKMSRK